MPATEVDSGRLCHRLVTRPRIENKYPTTTLEAERSPARVMKPDGAMVSVGASASVPCR